MAKDEVQDPFSGPGESGPGITTFEGHLLLVTPTEYIDEMTTAYGDTDAVVADMVVLDGPELEEEGVPEEFPETYIFQNRLIAQTKRKVNRGMILGRLGKKKAEKKGYSDAWSLEDPDEDDKQKARDYLATKEPWN